MAVALGLGVAIGKFSGPARVEIKETEKIVYKEAIQEKRNTSETIKSKETKLPDGTVITESVTRTKDKTETQSTMELDRKVEVITKSETLPSVRMGLIYNNETPLLDVQVRVLGSIYVGGNISKEGRPGASISIGF